jgi:hypothetical protein
MSELDLNAIVKNASGEDLSEIEANQDVYTSYGFSNVEGQSGSSTIKWTPALADRPSDKVADDEPWLYRVSTSEPIIKLQARGYKNRPEEAEVLQPYQKDSDGDLTPFSVNGLSGFIVDLEVGASLGYYDSENNRPVTKCQVIGCSSMVKEPQGRPFNLLPRIPLGGSMFGFDKNAGTPDYTTPAKPVLAIDPVGSRGEKCVDCIRRGHATEPHGDKTIQCAPNGYLYMVVTEFLQLKHQKDKDGITIPKVSKRKKVEDLLDEEGNSLKPFISAVKLTRTSSGGWNNDLRMRTVGTQYYAIELSKAFKSNPTDSEGNRKEDIRYWPVEVFPKEHISNNGKQGIKPKLHIQVRNDALLFHTPESERKEEMSRISKLEISPKERKEREAACQLWESIRPDVEGRPLKDEEYKGNLDNDTQIKSASSYVSDEGDSSSTDEDPLEFFNVDIA